MPETANSLSIVRRQVAAIEQAASLAAMAGDGDGAFDGDGQPLQWAMCFGRLIEPASLGKDSLGLEVDEGMELWIEGFDLANVRSGELLARDLSGGDESEQVDCGLMEES
jgi:hypothetical protein